MREIIEKVEAQVKEILSNEATGHDWYHIAQVRDMALCIAAKEGGDTEMIELAALVHDVGDHKFYASHEEGEKATLAVLEAAGVPQDMTEKIMLIVNAVSFSGGKVPESLEGKVVQDADRMFALGAIGVARAFAYGGKKGRMIHDPALSREAPTTINHFYEKLLCLKDMMNTKTGREIATERHAYLEGFLKQFYAEWNGAL